MKKFGIKSMETAFDADDIGEAFDKLFADSVPSDFYFHVTEDQFSPGSGYSMVHIVPVDFFEETTDNDDRGRCWDQHLNLDHLLPPGEFGCEMECVWGSEKSKEETEFWLLSQGFLQNAEFSEIVEEGYR